MAFSFEEFSFPRLIVVPLVSQLFLPTVFSRGLTDGQPKDGKRWLFWLVSPCGLQMLFPFLHFLSSWLKKLWNLEASSFIVETKNDWPLTAKEQIFQEPLNLSWTHLLINCQSLNESWEYSSCRSFWGISYPRPLTCLPRLTPRAREINSKVGRYSSSRPWDNFPNPKIRVLKRRVGTWRAIIWVILYLSRWSSRPKKKC